MTFLKNAGAWFGRVGLVLVQGLMAGASTAGATAVASYQANPGNDPRAVALSAATAGIAAAGLYVGGRALPQVTLWWKEHAPKVEGQ